MKREENKDQTGAEHLGISPGNTEGSTTNQESVPFLKRNAREVVGGWLRGLACWLREAWSRLEARWWRTWSLVTGKERQPRKNKTHAVLDAPTLLKTPAVGVSEKEAQTGVGADVVPAGTPAEAERPKGARVLLRERVSDFFSRLLSRFSDVLRFHFPLCLAETERIEGDLPVANSWYWLLLCTLTGTGMWLLATVLVKRRLAGVSIAIAFLIAVGIVLSLSLKFGLKVGFVAASLVVVSLLLGEIVVQQLYRANIIKLLDLTKFPASMSNSMTYVYRNYFYYLIVLRLLPPMVIAFLIGWWPLSRRPAWRGFDLRRTR